jgi:hypothetical protein
MDGKLKNLLSLKENGMNYQKKNLLYCKKLKIMNLIDNDDYLSVFDGLSEIEIKEIISKNIENMCDLEKLSVKDFLKHGKVSGSFFMALRNIIKETQKQMLTKIEKIL